jgi:hypothetical protein
MRQSPQRLDFDLHLDFFDIENGADELNNRYSHKTKPSITTALRDKLLAYPAEISEPHQA